MQVLLALPVVVLLSASPEGSGPAGGPLEELAGAGVAAMASWLSLWFLRRRHIDSPRTILLLTAILNGLFVLISLAVVMWAPMAILSSVDLRMIDRLQMMVSAATSALIFWGVTYAWLLPRPPGRRVG